MGMTNQGCWACQSDTEPACHFLTRVFNTSRLFEETAPGLRLRITHCLARSSDYDDRLIMRWLQAPITPYVELQSINWTTLYILYLALYILPCSKGRGVLDLGASRCVIGGCVGL